MTPEEREAINHHIAADRPFKKAMTLSQVIAMLDRTRRADRIGADRLQVFVGKRIDMNDANRVRSPCQLEQPDPAEIPGYGHEER